MNTHETVRQTLAGSDFIVTAYLDDMTDDELLVRPVEGCNHIAWQLGHLIGSEHAMIETACPDSMPPLPEGFAEKHTKETAGVDDAGAFLKKDEYLNLYRQQREGTLSALAKLSEEDFARPTPEKWQQFAPTVGSLFTMQATHWMMHAGQWAVIRRKLGRPPLF